jgi:hypothetical protein
MPARAPFTARNLLDWSESFIGRFGLQRADGRSGSPGWKQAGRTIMDMEPSNPVAEKELRQALRVEVYRRLLSSYFISTLAVAGLILLPSILAHARRGWEPPLDLPILVFVALFGAMGAFFSALMRLYRLEGMSRALTSEDLRRLRSPYLILYSLIPPITGVIGALVLYLAIAAGMVSGAAMQTFACVAPREACDGFAGFLSYAPATAQDYAKALVWGFIAGFSERFVPDALRRMARRDDD